MGADEVGRIVIKSKPEAVRTLNAKTYRALKHYSHRATSIVLNKIGFPKSAVVFA
jgi:hypothetical protein